MTGQPVWPGREAASPHLPVADSDHPRKQEAARGSAREAIAEPRRPRIQTGHLFVRARRIGKRDVETIHCPGVDKGLNSVVLSV
jgi:hypothetical protein